MIDWKQHNSTILRWKNLSSKHSTDRIFNSTDWVLFEIYSIIFSPIINNLKKKSMCKKSSLVMLSIGMLITIGMFFTSCKKDAEEIIIIKTVDNLPDITGYPIVGTTSLQPSIV